MIIKRTASGAGVFYPLHPIPLGFVFRDEETLLKARSRYWRIAMSYCLFCVTVFLFVTRNNVHNIGYAVLGFSFLACYLIIFLSMPERTYYDPRHHGPLAEPGAGQ